MKKLLMVLMVLILATFSIIGCSPPAEEPQTSDIPPFYYHWGWKGSEPPLLPSTDIDVTSDTPPTIIDITYVEGKVDFKWTKAKKT